MSELPGHISPSYSEVSRDDALFHYTSADGLIGILQDKEIRCTAYYCTNDETELIAGKGVLTPMFRNATHKLIQENHPLIQTFIRRGVDPMEYAETFEQMIIGIAFSRICAYIACFCRSSGEDDFLHGLLSQWRAYGEGGGYAIQFSRKKLLEELGKTNEAHKAHGPLYNLQDVHYTADNPLKAEVRKHTDAFVQAYKHHLDELGAPLDEVFSKRSFTNPIARLRRELLESLIDYLIHTKNGHFAEEKETRLSFIRLISSEVEARPTRYFNRGGLIVPYKTTSCDTFPILKCIEWIVIGPTPRMKARFESVNQMVCAAGLDVKVRPSHIPFYRG